MLTVVFQDMCRCDSFQKIASRNMLLYHFLLSMLREAQVFVANLSTYPIQNPFPIARVHESSRVTHGCGVHRSADCKEWIVDSLFQRQTSIYWRGKFG